MARKKSGHYCRGCGRYRANEKFSGKGHKQHICKDCKREGAVIEEEEYFPVIKQRHNPYMKPLKVKQIISTETDKYVFIQFQGKRYALILDFDDNPSVIYRYQKNNNNPFVVADELMKDFEEVLEVIWFKYSDRIEAGDYFEYELLEYYDQLLESEWENTEINQKFLRLLNCSLLSKML